MFHRCPYPHANSTRKDYLMYLVYNFVATPEEQEEFRTLQREWVVSVWNRGLNYDNELVDRDIAHYKKMIMRSRSTVEGLEYANKMQEVVCYMEKYRVRSGVTPHLKGFVSGWG